MFVGSNIRGSVWHISPLLFSSSLSSFQLSANTLIWFLSHPQFSSCTRIRVGFISTPLKLMYICISITRRNILWKKEGVRICFVCLKGGSQVLSRCAYYTNHLAFTNYFPFPNTLSAKRTFFKMNNALSNEKIQINDKFIHILMYINYLLF